MNKYSSFDVAYTVNKKVYTDEEINEYRLNWHLTQSTVS